MEHRYHRTMPATESSKPVALQYRVCTKFAPSSDNKDVCECGRSHRPPESLTPSKGWRMEVNTQIRPYDYDGQRLNHALCARITPDIHLARVNTLLDSWGIPKPNLIMSIVGGTTYSPSTDQLEKRFIQDIVDIVTESNVWMITNGYNLGIVRLIAQALRKPKLKQTHEKIIALGICQWGCVKKTDLPKQCEKKAHNSESWTEYPKDKRSNRKDVQYELEKNHSHYLMLDDGRYGYLDNNDFRSRLCHHMADPRMPSVVSLVVGGDTGTIANIYYDLRNKISVVITAGTGGVADFFKRWLSYTEEIVLENEDNQTVYEVNEYDTRTSDVSNSQFMNIFSGRPMTIFHAHLDGPQTRLERMFKKHEDQLQQDLGSILHDDSDFDQTVPKHSTGAKNELSKESKEAYRRVLYCLQPAVRDNITMFTPSLDNSLSEVVFESIYESYQRSADKTKNDSPRISGDSSEEDTLAQGKARLLQLAIEWNCIEVAKAHVLENSVNNILEPKKAFLAALKRDRPTFIYEFIKLKIDLTEIFFPGSTFFKSPKRYDEFLGSLYDENIIEKDESLLRMLIEEQDDLAHRKIDSVEALNVILRVLVGDYMHQLYFDSAEEEHWYRARFGLEKKSKALMTNSLNSSNDPEKEIVKDYIMRDLFLWAILMDRIEMAKVFLAYMKYRICPALIATKILKKFHLKAVHEDVKISYQDNATYFEQYAIDCLRECVAQNADRACKLVVLENKLYGYVTCLQVAAEAEDKLFIAMPCCVQTMDYIWYDKLYPDQTRKRDMLALALGVASLGLTAPPFVRYREVASVKTGESLQKILRSNGIDYHDSYPLRYSRFSQSMTRSKRYFYGLTNFHSSPMIRFCYHFFFTLDNLTFAGKCRTCFRDPFKPMTLLAFLLFYIGLIVRFAYADSQEHFVVARVIMAIDIELWWLRSLSFIIVIPFLGPHLVAIWKMLKDLMFFICIIAIVMIGYGVASRSMVYYPAVNGFTTATEGGTIDTRFDGRSVFRQIIYPVYYLLYNELDAELSALDSNPNAGWSIATEVLLAAHMMFVNILLTNLLIAMFSKRFEQVYEETKNIWYSQKYLFTREYFARSPFLPPISLIYDVWRLYRMIRSHMQRKCSKKEGSSKLRVFRMIPKDESLIKKWRDFESASTYKYAHKEAKTLESSSIKLSTQSDVDETLKERDVVQKQYRTGDTAATAKQIQEYLSQLKLSLEEVNSLCKKKSKEERKNKQQTESDRASVQTTT